MRPTQERRVQGRLSVTNRSILHVGFIFPSHGTHDNSLLDRKTATFDSLSPSLSRLSFKPKGVVCPSHAMCPREKTGENSCPVTRPQGRTLTPTIIFFVIFSISALTCDGLDISFLSSSLLSSSPITNDNHQEKPTHD